MKISSFIIALILVGVIATTFTMTVVDYTDKYGVTYDDEELAVFENTTALMTLAEDLETRTNEQTVESGIVDMVGAYIGRALDALKLSMTSFGVFERMASAATDKIGLPSYFLGALVAIVLILIVFVIISAMIKKDV